MFRKLPFEIVTLIACYIPIEAISAFASTCRRCYFASLPQLWHHISLNSLSDLLIINKHLKSNMIRSQEAIKFVKDISISCKPKSEPSSYSFMIMLGVARNDIRQQDLDNNDVKGNSRENITTFAKHLFGLFPHLTNLVVDYTQAINIFYGMDDDNMKIPFSGSLSLVNYKADNAHFMHNILSPFNQVDQLTVQAHPVRSLCDDVDESILTDADIKNLSTLRLNHLTLLKLSYLDSNINLDVFSSLLKSMPCLHDLYLKWIFPPKKEAYQLICQCIQHNSSLYPQILNPKNINADIHFVYSNPVSA